jgi:hypothetical protein
MATRLPQVQGGQVQIGGVPNAVLPEVQFGQRDVSSGYQAQARYQQSVSTVIDRMTQTVFGVAEGMSQRAGLQFAAENPLTTEQLEAMSKGDMSQVSLGSPLNVFNSAVRKARAIEVSGHAEVEAREQMVVLLEKANMGQMDATQAQDQIAAITNGYGEALAQIDPDASYKYRATMAAVGGRVLEKVAELDGQKRMIGNTVKVQRLYTTMQQEIALASTTKMPIDQRTGQEIPADVYIDALKTNFLSNAQALIGTNAALQYVNNIDNDINVAKVNAISQSLITDPKFANDPNAINRLIRGDAGSASNAYQTLLPDDKAKVMAAYMTHTSQQHTLQQKGQAQASAAVNKSYQALELTYALAQVTGNDEVAANTLAEMLSHQGLTADRVRDISTKNRTSSPEGVSKLEAMVRDGLITTREQLSQFARDFKVFYDDGKLGPVVNTFNNLYAATNGSYVKNQIRAAANVPEGLVQLDAKSDYAKKIAQYTNEFSAAQTEALRTGQPFDPKQTVDDIAKRAIQSRQSADAQAAKNQLQVYEEKIGNTAITLANIESLRYRVENGQEKRLTKSQLLVIENLLKQIEGL